MVVKLRALAAYWLSTVSHPYLLNSLPYGLSQHGCLLPQTSTVSVVSLLTRQSLIYHNIATGVISHHLYYVLLVRKQITGTVHTQEEEEYTKAWTPGGGGDHGSHLRLCSPYMTMKKIHHQIISNWFLWTALRPSQIKI